MIELHYFQQTRLPFETHFQSNFSFRFRLSEVGVGETLLEIPVNISQAEQASARAGHVVAVVGTRYPYGTPTSHLL